MKFQHCESKEIYEIEPDPRDTVGDIKKKLSAKISVPIDRIRLFNEDRIFDNSELINRDDIGSGDCVVFDYEEAEIIDTNQAYMNFMTICRVFNLYHMSNRTLKIHVENYTGIGSRSFDCKVNPNEKIDCLKMDARDRGCGGGFVEQAVFFLDNSILSIDKSFRYYGIKDSDTIVMARDRNNKDERPLTENEIRGMHCYKVALSITENNKIDETTFKLSVINCLTNENLERFDVKQSEKVWELKRDIFRRLKLEEDTKWIDVLHQDQVLLNDDRTMFDCGMKEGDTVEIVQRKLCLKPLNGKCEPIECMLDKASTTDTAIHAILNHYDIDDMFKSSIKLFKDQNKIDHIKNDSDIFDFLSEDTLNGTSGYQIYYFIKPIVDNLYRKKVLGKGASSLVYLCADTDSNNPKALKKFDLSSNSTNERCDFKREISVYEKLGDHPRIIKYERHFETETASFILMEYMSGGSLTSHVRTNGPLSEDKISKYAKQICEGLKHLHDNKIIHRDVKGENILIDSNDNIKLSDFGLSKILIDSASRSNSCVGTTYYMAPEVIERANFGSAADIWSFGATMVEMVTGKLPLHWMNAFQVRGFIMTKKPIPFSYPPNSSDQIKSFIDRCLQVDPLKRSTVDALLSDAFLS